MSIITDLVETYSGRKSIRKMALYNCKVNVMKNGNEDEFVE